MPLAGIATTCYRRLTLAAVAECSTLLRRVSQNALTAGRNAFQPPSAASKSSIRSSLDSRPTDSRTSPSPIPAPRAPRPTSRMRSGRRPRHQSLDAAKARRADRYRHAIHETPRRVEAARELEAQHAAEAVEQLARAQVIRVALEPGIVHPRDRAMLLEQSRNLERAFILMAHAHRERLHPAMQQEACVRIEARRQDGSAYA